MARRARDRQIGWDQRFGVKVYARKLREDGYMRGIYTLDPDPPHPQDYLVPPGADGLGRGQVFPPMHTTDVVVVPGAGVMNDLMTSLALPVLAISTGGAV